MWRSDKFGDRINNTSVVRDRLSGMLDRSPVDTDTVLAAIEAMHRDMVREIGAVRELFEAHIGMAPVDEGDELWAAAAAVIVHKTPETIRNWCEQHAIGKLDKKSRRYIISRRKLRAFLISRHGSAPAELD